MEALLSVLGAIACILLSFILKSCADTNRTLSGTNVALGKVETGLAGLGDDVKSAKKAIAECQVEITRTSKVASDHALICDSDRAAHEKRIAALEG